MSRSSRKTQVEPAAVPMRLFSPPSPATPPEHALPRLTHHLAQISIRPSLPVIAPGDASEQEAERAARQVTRRLASPELPAGASGSTPSPAETALVRPSAAVAPRADEAAVLTPHAPVEAPIDQAQGGGQSLPEQVREPMEQAFGHSFAHVRVHVDQRADTMSRAIRARAFTAGDNIFFKRGAYQPAIPAGQELLAHELTHVVQQGGEPRSIQRDTAEETATKLEPFKMLLFDQIKQLNERLKSYEQYMEQGDLKNAYQLHAKLQRGLAEVQRLIGNQDMDEEILRQAIDSLKWWQSRLLRESGEVTSKSDEVAEEDKNSLSFFWTRPPLTLEEGERLLDGLRSGAEIRTLLQEMRKSPGVPPNTPRLTDFSKAMLAVPPTHHKREWGLAELALGGSQQYVIVKGGDDSTPFSSYPYLKPVAHSHPRKEYVKDPGNSRRAALTRELECPVEELFAERYENFAIDLLPSKIDITLMAERGTPQKVFAHYKYDAAAGTIVNPAVAEKTGEKRDDLEQMAWVNFTYGDPLRYSPPEEEPLYVFRLTMKAGTFVKVWENVKTQRDLYLTLATEDTEDADLKQLTSFKQQAEALGQAVKKGEAQERIIELQNALQARFKELPNHLQKAAQQLRASAVNLAWQVIDPPGQYV